MKRLTRGEKGLAMENPFPVTLEKFKERKCVCMICANVAPADEADVRTIEDVKQYGFSTLRIVETKSSAKKGFVPYTFSVGLWHSYRQPELVIMGLPFDASRSIISSAADLMKNGEVLEPGFRAEGIIQSYGCHLQLLSGSGSEEAIRALDPIYRDYLGTATYFNLDAFPVFQIVWPSKDLAWPWEDNWPVGVGQPLLAVNL